MAPTPAATATSALTPFFNPGAIEHFTDPEHSLAVLHDLFPAEVCFSATPLPPADGHGGAQAANITLPKCRVLISPDAVYVFADGPRGPVLAFYDELDPAAPPVQTATKGYDLTPANPGTHSVSAVSVEPTNRCGCGSRLRGYRPFGRISYIPSS